MAGSHCTQAPRQIITAHKVNAGRHSRRNWIHNMPIRDTISISGVRERTAPRSRAPAPCRRASAPYGFINFTFATSIRRVGAPIGTSVNSTAGFPCTISAESSTDRPFPENFRAVPVPPAPCAVP